MYISDSYHITFHLVQKHAISQKVFTRLKNTQSAKRPPLSSKARNRPKVLHSAQKHAIG